MKTFPARRRNGWRLIGCDVAPCSGAHGTDPRRPAARGGVAVVLLAILPCIVTTPVRGQDVGSTVQVTVTEADTGEPIAGAVVEVPGTPMAALTDDAGRATLHRLANGPQHVTVRHFGYRAVRRPVVLEPGQTYQLAFTLEPDPVPLAEVRVRAQRRMPSGAALGFHRRLETGIGRFITRQDIEEHRPRRFADLLRMIPGLRLNCNSIAGSCELATRSSPASLSTDMRASRGSQADNSCPVQYYVDGLYQPYDNVNALRPEDIEAIEVYAHGHQAPARYSMRKNARCGVVLVWMRMTLEPVRRR